MGRDKKRKKQESETSSSDENQSESDNDTESQSSSEGGHRSIKPEKSKPSKHKKSKHHHKHSSRRKEKRKKSRDGEHETISDDDYFKKSSEFRSWLSNERGIYFSDLSSAKSRKLFSKFVRKWNTEQLKQTYYDGIQSSSLEHSSQTKYKWKLADQDDIKMGSVRDNVSSWTSGKGSEGEEKKFKSHKSIIGPERPPAISKATRGPERPPVEYLDPHLIAEARQDERKLLQKSRKYYRKHNEMVMDELVPKATGFQARIDKKLAISQQRRDKDISPDPEDSLLMGSDNRIKEKLKSKQNYRERRAQIASQKISDYKEKEKSKVAAILEMARANKKEGSLW